MLNTDNTDPNLVRLRTLKLDPNVVKSKTLAPLLRPNLIDPATLNPDPRRASALTEKDEPACAKLRIDADEPQRAKRNETAAVKAHCEYTARSECTH